MNVDLRGAFWTPSATILGSASKMYERIVRSIFANGEQGFAYDPNDLTTLFQDAAGTIPVTSTGQPVGLVLDKSKGLKLGVELFNQFNSTLNSTLSQNTLPCVVTSTVSGGVFGVAAANIFQVGIYKIEFTWSGNSNQAEMGVQLPNGNNLSLGTGVTGSFSKVMNFTSTGSFSITKSAPQVGQTFTVSAVSIKKIDGNHAYQTVSASRPILRQTPILGAELVTNGNFATDVSGWAGGNGGVISKSLNGMKITSSTSANTQASQRALTLANKVVVVSAKFMNKVSTGAALVALWSSPTGTIGSSVAPASAVEGVLSFTVQVPNGFSGDLILQVNNSVAGNSVEFSDVSVKEITGYRTGQNYLEFDGVDDFLQTSAVDFTATDEVSLFAGVRKLRGAATEIILELSANTNLNNGTFHMSLPQPVGGVQVASRGTALSLVPTAALLSPINLVISGGCSITPPLNYVSANGNKFSSAANQGSGNYGNYPLYIGRRAGISLPFSGNLYGLIGVGRLTTGGETLAVERELAKQTGVVLNV